MTQYELFMYQSLEVMTYNADQKRIMNKYSEESFQKYFNDVIDFKWTDFNGDWITLMRKLSEKDYYKHQNARNDLL